MLRVDRSEMRGEATRRSISALLEVKPFEREAFAFEQRQNALIAR